MRRIKLISGHALHYSTQHKYYKHRLTVLKCNYFVGYQHGSDSIVYVHSCIIQKWVARGSM